MHSRVAAVILSLLSVFAFAAPALAKDPVYTARFSNLAVDGYDPVAYFTEGEPVKGAKEFTYEYLGADWRFSSQENLDAFIADPTAYAPQYGGYCAWAIAQGYLARGNPKNWTIYEGRLFLNYNDKIQARWLADIPGFVAKADENWPDVLE